MLDSGSNAKNEALAGDDATNPSDPKDGPLQAEGVEDQEKGYISAETVHGEVREAKEDAYYGLADENVVEGGREQRNTSTHDEAAQPVPVALEDCGGEQEDNDLAQNIGEDGLEVQFSSAAAPCYCACG